MWLLVALLFVTGCTTLPEVHDKPVVMALPSAQTGPLAVTAKNLAKGRKKSESSMMLLESGREALDWRLAMVDSAVRSLDIQLYMWKGGASGTLLLERVMQAAERGVRVRILVDYFLNSKDAGLASLSRYHPNLDVRIFNPTKIRGSSLARLPSILANFEQMNRRMHNKAFMADGCMAIVGGRNFADEYFGLAEDYNFLDLDVLVSGPVVSEVSMGFDEFWNSSQAYPGAMLSKKGSPEMLRDARLHFRELLEGERDGKLREFPIERRNWRRELATLDREMVEGTASFIQDEPEVHDDDRVLVGQLTRMAREQKRELQLATPYLIPSDRGIDRTRSMSDAGTRVGVLVPTLAASDHALVAGHYNKYRKRLLDAGVELYEFRGDPSEEIRSLADTSPVRSERVTLHLKAVVGNRNHCFIGSLNLDPRAVKINTESGMLIESPELAGQLAELIDLYSNHENSWSVSRDDKGRVTWESRGETRKRKPKAKWTRRVGAWLGGLLPIKDQI
ncbi:phospholipase D family protein [Haloferula sp.]|uniref:phospholipase D family protein n=1 Tax=Haloferula sp. TaxID=2497595 RepID=UPI00329F5BFE